MSKICSAIKKDGKQCSYKVKNGEYCGVHSKSSETPTINNESFSRFSFGNKGKSLVSIGFDFDGTIANTKSGKQFPINKDDWKLLDGVKDKLINVKENIIFISNQNGKNFNLNDFKEKLSNIHKELGVGFEVFVAMEKNKYRKPCTGFDDEFLKGNMIYFVGDAAGRQGDHSDTDLKFAKNLSIPFFTPEEYFQGKSPSKMTIDYPTFKDHIYDLYIPKAKLIILTGFPGSGKTFYCENYLKSYERVKIGRAHV